LAVLAPAVVLGTELSGESALMDDPREPGPPVPTPGQEPSSVAEPVRRPRLSRPTPSQLFAERKGDEGDNGRKRTTRVIPALAEAGVSPKPPAAAELPAPAPAGLPTPALAAGRAPEPGQVLDYPPDIVFIVRADGTVLYINRPLGRRGEEEIIGSQFTDWIFPDQHSTVRDALQRVFSTGHADGVELTGIQGHDPDASFECRIAPNQRDGKVVSVTVISRDVSRYRQLERTLRARHDELQRQLDDRLADLDVLREQLAAGQAGAPAGSAHEQRFRTALDAAGEAIFLVDPEDETLVDLNDTGCRWLRRHLMELRGVRVSDLGLAFPLVPPPSLDVQFTETRDSRRPLVLEGEHRRTDGSTFPVEVSVSQVVGDRPYILAVARDVKDRRRAQDAIAEGEHRYRALLDQSFDAVYLTTRGGEIVEANNAALELFGYRRDEFIGLDARTIMPHVDDIRHFQRIMAAERFVARLEVTLRRRAGSAFAAVLSASRRRDGHDRLLGYQWVVRALPGGDVAEPEPAEPAVVQAPMLDPTDGVVLLVGGGETVREEGVHALERAGLAVLEAPDPATAIRLLRSHAGSVRLAVVSETADEKPEDTARDLLALDARLQVLLVREGGEHGLTPADLSSVTVLPAPIHPLALLQAVREALRGARR
jgi:PAS domain S-box-containing protein